MGQALDAKRDNLFAQAIVAKPADFDSIWDSGYEDYLNSGARAIQEERAALYDQYYK